MAVELILRFARRKSFPITLTYHLEQESERPAFIDVHRHVSGLTASVVHDAPQKDLTVQAERDVQYLGYWISEVSGDVFCLVRAPDKETAVRVHAQAHGLLPDEVVEVPKGLYGHRFLSG